MGDPWIQRFAERAREDEEYERRLAQERLERAGEVLGDLAQLHRCGVCGGYVCRRCGEHRPGCYCQEVTP